ncbi:MAG: type II toxin-antitoxin system HicB family antitoxin [Actinomycetota bacterium]|nr:type II toxin-antitoxin system HicB family antitoxin [Actinomycetota bacterium]
MKEYLVIYEQAEDGGWGAHTPDIEGVFALGRTREQVEERMAEALNAYVELMQEEGRPIPEPRTEAGRVAAGVPTQAS